MLKCCLNGQRSPTEHPAVPVTPAAIARVAADAVAAGADAIHFHAKDSEGSDTLDPIALAAAVEALRVAVPGVPLGTTTGEWAAPDPAERVRLVGSWSVRPDFASVNWHEPGADDVAAALLSMCSCTVKGAVAGPRTAMRLVRGALGQRTRSASVRRRRGHLAHIR